MFLGYNTNGLAHHELFDAVGLLAEIGYRGVAITIDHHAPPPYAARPAAAGPAVAAACSTGWEMRSVIETGARFLLDPRREARADAALGEPRQADRLLQVRR